MATKTYQDAFGVQKTLNTSGGDFKYFSLPDLSAQGIGHIDKLPFSIKVLLEAALRNVDEFIVSKEDVTRLSAWNPTEDNPAELPFMPGRVVLQDFTGVPAVVDLASLREACHTLGSDPKKINPLVPCDLVIDHSVQVDHFGTKDAAELNAKIEFERNRERYEFLKWGQTAFDNFRVVPPKTGIVHQVNLEYLANVVMNRDGYAYPDSLVGTDSHTTMINGLGVAGWGVGGIEAEAVMLGQPVYMLTPKVVGFKLTGELPEGATATDLVLTITQTLRGMGVVGQFVEFYGPGLATMSLADRATIANMAPEYGATMGFFPVDEVTMEYLRGTGRDADQCDLVERYCKAQGMWREAGSEPSFSRTAELDISSVVPSLAGPKRPQDRILLTDMKSTWNTALPETFGHGEGGTPAAKSIEVEYDGKKFELQDGAVVIAAITSCTNTSNPSVMLGAGLVARNAVAKGLDVKPWVKTSLGPGSRVVTEYLEKSGLNESLDTLGFNVVGYGCTTCIGNSGPLPAPISKGIHDGDLVACSVLSGNRNFEGRVSPDVKANYLASPPLVVAYAIAGTVDIDLSTEPLGKGSDGQDVYLKDIWPSQEEIQQTVNEAVTAEQFTSKYGDVFAGDEMWQAVAVSGGDRYNWDDNSTYIQHPSFFEGIKSDPDPIASVEGARVLVMMGDSVTTDHISPAGAIKADSPAGRFLQEKGVQQKDFNSYGSRRGNDRVMCRGTFANIRIRNLLAPGTEGGVTTYLPTNSQMDIFDAAMEYKKTGTPLVVLAGKEYGTGSSRDWAAKGTFLQGIKAVIAESFERIHRSNLVGMGVLPLQFKDGEGREALGLTGHESFNIELDDNLKPGQDVPVTATDADGSSKSFTVTCRIDTPVEVNYYRNGGILHTVLLKLVNG